MHAKSPTVLMKAAHTYNMAADHFDHDVLGFWKRHGQKTVDLLNLQEGAHVLDVGCGTGSSAIPAAKSVGPTGSVLGVDVAKNMLSEAEAKAYKMGYDNARFILADMGDMPLDNSRFDAIISVFSIFFVQDVEAQVARLWRAIRPGGKLALTVWSKDAFEPGAYIFGEEFRKLRPENPTSFRPWERFTSIDSLHQLLRSQGIDNATYDTSTDRQALDSCAEFWTLAMGSGFRFEIEQLNDNERIELRVAVTERLRQDNVRAIETTALHAVAVK